MRVAGLCGIREGIGVAEEGAVRDRLAASRRRARVYRAARHTRATPSRPTVTNTRSARKATSRIVSVCPASAARS